MVKISYKVILFILMFLVLFNNLIGQTHFTFNETEDYYSVVINSATINGVSLENGDEVGVFFRDEEDSLKCAGAVIWSNQALSAWEDDYQTSEKDGFDPGEVLIFKFYDSSEGTEIADISTIFSIGDGTFGDGSYAICDLNASDPSNIKIHITDLRINYKLYQNYPNPFNPSTTIRYGLPEPSQVSLAIYGSNGQLIKCLEDSYKDSGYYQVMWDGTNQLGSAVSTGVYLYVIKAGKFSTIKKMIFIK